MHPLLSYKALIMFIKLLALGLLSNSVTYASATSSSLIMSANGNLFTHMFLKLKSVCPSQCKISSPSQCADDEAEGPVNKCKSK